MPKFPIVGMAHRKPAPAVMALLPPDTRLYLVREPSNEFDVNAIQVWIEDFAGKFPASVEEVADSCRSLEIEMPDLSQPFMLGYIKAASVNEHVLGAEYLAPNIDQMVNAGEIESAADIPCKLVYGESGRPSLEIIVEEDEAVAEEAAGEVQSGLPSAEQIEAEDNPDQPDPAPAESDTIN